MGLTDMANIPFPNVPNVPGVPAIPRSPNVTPSLSAGLGLLQGILWRTFQVDTRWGIFDSKGQALGDPAQITGFVGQAMDSAGIGSTLSTNSVDYSKETRVSDFPVEGGTFANYNKVELPASPIVTLCLTGSENNRRTFLEAIDTACKSTDKYSVVTPEVTYVDYSIERYNYSRRASKGATLLIVEISLKEIREVSAAYVKTQINKPKEPAATPPVDGGKVQAQLPQPSTLKSLANKLPGLANRAATYIQGLVN